MMNYDPVQALQSIDQNTMAIFVCLGIAVAFSFVYFLIGIRMAIRQQVYVVPFLGAALFFWHDLSFLLNHSHWVAAYNNHWWLKMWTYALGGTVALEMFLIWQFIHYGRKEFMPEASEAAFAGMTIIGVIGIGAFSWLVKSFLNDDIYLITFLITAYASLPFHTGIMLRRRSTAGQSIAMNLSVFVIMGAISTVGILAVPSFWSPVYLANVAVFMLWPLLNIWLIRRLPSSPQYPAVVPITFGPKS